MTIRSPIHPIVSSGGKSQHFRTLLICALLLTIAGCQRPGVKEKQSPIASEPAISRVLDPRRLSPGAKKMLAGVRPGSFQRHLNPAQTVRQLLEELGSDLSEPNRTALVEVICHEASTLDGQQALGLYLCAAELSYPAAVSPSSEVEDDGLLFLYNHACSKVSELAFSMKPNWEEPMSIPGPLSDYVLKLKTGDKGLIDPNHFDGLKIAEYLEVLGYQRREVEMGVGGALVGHREYRPERAEREPFLPEVGMALPVTATLRFDTQAHGQTSVEFALHDVLITDTTRLEANHVNLAMDLTAPLAVLSSLAQVRNLGVKGMIRPAEYLSQAGLFELEPYRPNKIPVVMVHGLSKTPAVWIPAINELRADPTIREHYQFLLFRYPTGLPALYCGSMLRQHLQRYRQQVDPRGDHESMRKMVLIGKSFGGIVSSLQLRDSGDSIRALFSDRPLSEFDIPASERLELQNLLVFNADRDISRVIFMVTPHRGTDVADKSLVRFANRIIKYPMSVITDFELQSQDGMTALARSYITHPPTSISDLKSTSPVINAIAGLPFGPRLTIHSIIGKVGNGPLEESNDLLVPYWSSHLEAAASEVVIDCNHGEIGHHPDSLKEIHRILLLHLTE